MSNATAIDTYRLEQWIGYEVEAAIVRNNQEACAAWRSGKLPTADPPATPVLSITGSCS